MPLVNISLLKGKSREHIRAIANGVHEALKEAYKVPEQDRFQLIRQYDRDGVGNRTGHHHAERYGVPGDPATG